MKARLLLAAAAILAWLFGVMLLFNSRAFEAPMGIVLDDKTATIAQAQGAILLGLGLINWLARGVTEDAALRAVLWGNLLVQVASLAVAARAMLVGIFPKGAIGAIVIHVVLGGAFAWALMRLRTQPQVSESR